MLFVWEHDPRSRGAGWEWVLLQLCLCQPVPGRGSGSTKRVYRVEHVRAWLLSLSAGGKGKPVIQTFRELRKIKHLNHPIYEPGQQDPAVVSRLEALFQDDLI